jgi:hypothetical protein
MGVERAMKGRALWYFKFGFQSLKWGAIKAYPFSSTLLCNYTQIPGTYADYIVPLIP